MAILRLFYLFIRRLPCARANEFDSNELGTQKSQGNTFGDHWRSLPKHLLADTYTIIHHLRPLTATPKGSSGAPKLVEATFA